MQTPTPVVVQRRIPLPAQQAGVHPTWRARVASATGECEAYLKWLEPRPLLVECVCAMLGRALTLPIPRPLLAQDAELGLLFGAEAIEHPDLRLALLPTATLTEHLRGWKQLPLACAFDTWIANADRNQGNLLTNGAGEFWLIDHEHAIPPGFPPQGASINQLLRAACTLFGDDLARRRLLQQLGFSVEQINPALLDRAGQLDDWLASDVLDFLRCRNPYLWRLLRTDVTGNHELPGI